MTQALPYKNFSLLGTALVCAALLGGCATTDNLNRAQATADQALQRADQASQKADQANATAGEAKSTADSAKTESAATSEKLDRMFKKTMQK